LISSFRRYAEEIGGGDVGLFRNERKDAAVRQRGKKGRVDVEACPSPEKKTLHVGSEKKEFLSSFYWIYIGER